MSYKSILVHVNNSRNVERRYELAFEVAKRESAHVLGAAMTGVSPYVYQPSLIDGTDVGMVNYINTTTNFEREQARKALERFKDIAKTKAIPFEARLVEDEPHAGLTLLSRSCDLVVLSETDRDDPVIPPFLTVVKSRS